MHYINSYHSKFNGALNILVDYWSDKPSMQLRRLVCKNIVLFLHVQNNALRNLQFIVQITFRHIKYTECIKKKVIEIYQNLSHCYSLTDRCIRLNFLPL